MPQVGTKHFPYTPAGKLAAAKAKQKQEKARAAAKKKK